MEKPTVFQQFLSSPWGVLGILGLAGGAIALCALLLLAFGMDFGLTR